MKRLLYILLLVPCWLIAENTDNLLRIRHADGTVTDSRTQDIREIRFMREADKEIMRVSNRDGNEMTYAASEVRDVALMDVIERITYDTVITKVRRHKVTDTISVDSTLVDGYVDDPDKDGRVVLIYVPYWAKQLPNPNYATHVAYSCAHIYMPNGVYGGFQLVNDTTGKVLKQCVALKQKNPNLKVLLSFFDAGKSSEYYTGYGFSSLAASDTYRKQFAADCLAFCQKWGIDGVDIDWEVPTNNFNGLPDSPADKDNFRKMMKQLRTTLGTDRLVTYASYIMADKYSDDTGSAPYVDFINVMYYDAFEAPRPHNAMYNGGNSTTGGYWDIYKTYDSFHNAGYPMQKFVLGVPFYGHHKSGNDSELYYSQILARLKANPAVWTSRYNSIWQVPVLYKNDTIWCSYDDPSSITNKGNYAVQKGMGGLMAWQSDGDDGSKNLQKAMWYSQRCKPGKVWKYTYNTISYMSDHDTVVTPIVTLDTVLHVINR